MTLLRDNKAHVEMVPHSITLIKYKKTTVWGHLDAGIGVQF